MALTDKKYDKFYKETGSGDDKITTSNKEYLKTAFEFGATHGFHDIMDDPRIGPLVYMVQQMQDELDYLRTEISANKDKTGITTSQANAITANTAKTSMTIGTGATQAMAGNTTIPPISITGLPANHTFNVQVRVVPPVRGAKKGTVVLTWTIEDVPNKVVYSSNQTLI